MKAKEFIKLLPTDEEVAKWYDENIDPNDSTVSSSIYKFRLFLKENLDQKTEPKKYDLHGFLYTKEL